MELLSTRSKSNKIPSKKSSYIFLYFKKWNFLALVLKNYYIFSKESFSDILGNENPEKIPYISGHGTLLCFRKRKP